MATKKRLEAAALKELWLRWKNGESMIHIARALSRSFGTIWSQVAGVGGFVPAPRKRRRQGLTDDEREEISRGLAAELSLRAIARRLGREPSTICREVARNGGRSAYRAACAERAAWDRARRPKCCKLATNGRLRRQVAIKLAADWSPEQIVGWLKLEYPRDVDMHISTETIYRSLFIQARGVLKKELRAHLRTRRMLRHPKNATARRVPGIVDAVSIRERPAEAADRAVPGHWEGDLVAGAGFSYIATLVERSSRFTMLVKLPSKDTDTVVAALAKRITKLPDELKRSLTWDRGMELAAHKKLRVATDIAIYFCDPASPWQRGTNENTNGLLRQYFPTGTDLRTFSQTDLDKVAARLNGRPRKTLGFRTPAETLQAVLL